MQAYLMNLTFDKFGNPINKDYWTSMFNVKCIIKVSMLKAILPVNAISKALILLNQRICL